MKLMKFEWHLKTEFTENFQGKKEWIRGGDAEKSLCSSPLYWPSQEKFELVEAETRLEIWETWSQFLFYIN